MKKLFALTALLSTCVFACAQEKEKMLKEIDERIKDIESVIQLADMRVVITAGNEEEFDPTDDFNFETETAGDGSDTVLANFFKNQKANLSLMPPYNLVSINRREYELTKLMGQDNFYFMDNPDLKVTYTPIRFTFRNGNVKPAEGMYMDKTMIAQKHRKTEQTTEGEAYEYVTKDGMDMLEEALWESSNSEETIAVFSASPLAKIAYEVKLPAINQHVYQADALNKVLQTIYGDITLDTIAGQTVYCRLPITNGKHDIRIRAYYQDNRILRQKSYSSNSVVSEQDKALYAQMVSVLKDARENVRKGKIKQEAELVKYLQDNTPDASAYDPHGAATTRYKDAVYGFAGPVSRVEFIVNDTTIAYKTFMQEQSFYYTDEEKDYLVATDWETEKRGIIDHEGKWVVSPKFDGHFRIQNRYYYWDQINYQGNTYWFDHRNKTMQPVPYQINDPKIYAGRYVKIEPRTNGLKGVADAVTGKIVIPMVHAYLQYAEPGIWYGRDEETQLSGAYHADGSTLLPFSFSKIEVADGYLYTVYRPTKWIYDEQHEVFDPKGNNLTRGRYSEPVRTFSDGLLLMKKYNRDEDNQIKSTDYFYIDIRGNAKLSFPASEYHNATPFVNGLAKVEKQNDDQFLYDGDWGYIDTEGNVVIPFMYTRTYGFYGKYAYVELRDGEKRTYAFIDRNNNIVKKLDAGYQFSWFDDGLGKWVLRLWNDERYDYDGNKIEKNE